MSFFYPGQFSRQTKLTYNPPMFLKLNGGAAVAWDNAKNQKLKPVNVPLYREHAVHSQQPFRTATGFQCLIQAVYEYTMRIKTRIFTGAMRI